MKPVEFVLWLNGAAELVGDQPPTPEQWATMRGKLSEAVGELVAARLLERAEETLRADENAKATMGQMFGGLGQYQYQREAELAKLRMETAERAMRSAVSLQSSNNISGKGTT